MSANGEIEIAVSAEGVDDAAEELAGDDGAAGGGPPVGGGGGDDDQGLRGSLRAGAIAGALLSLLGPLLDVLSPILKVLQAFLAPVAVLLMRLLAPVLRFFIRLLPAWNAFIQAIPSLVSKAVDFILSLPGRIWAFVSSLPGMIWRQIKNGAQWITNGAAAIAEAVWNTFTDFVGWATDLPQAIFDALKGIGVDVLSLPGSGGFLDNVALPLGGPITPSVGPLALGAGTGTGGAGGASIGGSTGDSTRQPVVNIQGGLASFIENIERSSRVDR